MKKEKIPPASKNIFRLATLNIPGGGQVTVENGLAFVGHMDAPDGTTIIDVKDPSNPKILKQINEYSNVSVNLTFRPRFSSPDVSSRPYIQFFMRNPNLSSRIAKSFTLWIK